MMSTDSESPNPEQWKDAGNCKVCRKRSYCRKQCYRNRVLVQKMLRKARIYNHYLQIQEASAQKTVEPDGQEV